LGSKEWKVEFEELSLLYDEFSYLPALLGEVLGAIIRGLSERNFHG
jgi:hypothetical protein